MAVRCSSDSNSCVPFNTFNTNEIKQVWGSDASNVHFVGTLGTIVRCQAGTSVSCSTLSTGTTPLFSGVWGSDVSNVYVVGNAGKIMRCSGAGQAAPR